MPLVGETKLAFSSSIISTRVIDGEPMLGGEEGSPPPRERILAIMSSFPSKILSDLAVNVTTLLVLPFGIVILVGTL